MKKILIIPLFLLAACRGEEPTGRSTTLPVTNPDPAVGDITGFWLLNEGSMGTNKATLDYFDYATGEYHRNVFAERNPEVARELGDVGNDLQIHGQRLWAVINCSNMVEVMDAATGRHIGAVSIPNCRYVAFEGRYAYVSSYAGKVQMDPASRRGYVAKIDTATLAIEGTCEVGYQPEEMALVGDKLYVANSGGYRAPNYDRTVSVIDLASFSVTATIDVAPNLHRMEADRYGFVWVSSRGDDAGAPSKTFVIDSRTDRITRELDIPNANMTRWGDILYIYSEQGGFVTVDTQTQSPRGGSFLVDASFIKTPYGVAVNPATGEILVTDAKDYFTPGTLHCYTAAGVHKWQVTTGDIPAHIAFTSRAVSGLPGGGTGGNGSPLVAEVLDFMPAPGQFVNTMPLASSSDTPASMNAKALKALREKEMISLGGWGGYIVLKLAESVTGGFIIKGNAYEGNSEPGIVMVARDVNGNGAPDLDEWFELAGSASFDAEPWLEQAKAAGNDVETIRNYEMTWHRPGSDGRVPWTDNRGGSGTMVPNGFHTQSYYPLWAGASLTFKGTRLPQNAIENNGIFVLQTFRWGYADNAGDGRFDISNAVDGNGAKADLPSIDFIKIYSAVNQINGWTGECSTEISEITKPK